MANLFDQTKPQEAEGFRTNVDNGPKKPIVGPLGKGIIYFSFIFLFPIFIYIGWKNSFMRSQNMINEQASGIQVQEAKRADTIIKLVDTVKAYANHEKSIQEDVAKLRNYVNSANNSQPSIEETNELSRMNNSVFGRLMAVSENYPDLKANELFINLMDNVTYIEREIAAARRTYNSTVRQFNQDLFIYPKSVAANSLGLTTQPLFQASEQQRKDVNIGELLK